MQITDLPFQYGDRQAADELLEQLNALLADSDADRERIRKGLCIAHKYW